MSERPSFTDEELTAYLDGELEETAAGALQAALEQNAELRARLDRLTLDTSQISSAFDALLASAPQVPDIQQEIATPRGWSRRKSLGAIAAAVTLSLFVGGGAAYLAKRSDLETWDQYVAAYHALYVNGTLARVEQTEPQAAAQLEQISTALGKPVAYSTVTGLDGLDYKRAQILGYEGRPLLQMTFLSKVGAPIALCIIRSENSRSVPLQVRTMEGMSSAYWAANGYEYLLIGGSDPDLIESVATKLTKTL